MLARLRNSSKSSGAPFQQGLQHYAIERFLYRISKSKHAQGVILKGTLLLKTIGIPSARPTMDIDMLRKGKADTLGRIVGDLQIFVMPPLHSLANGEKFALQWKAGKVWGAQ